MYSISMYVAFFMLVSHIFAMERFKTYLDIDLNFFGVLFLVLFIYFSSRFPKDKSIFFEASRDVFKSSKYFLVSHVLIYL